MIEDSLKKRYIIKLLGSIIGGVIGSILIAVVPKALGPVAFGQFSYLQQFFTQFIAFLDAGTSTAFFTKLSAKNTRKELISFYMMFSFLLLFILLSIFGMIDMLSYTQFLFPSIPSYYVYLGIGFGFLVWLTQIYIKISDAYALTVSVEVVKIVHKIISLMILLYIINYMTFNLNTYFYYHYMMLILFMMIITFLFIRMNVFSLSICTFHIPVKNLIKEFTIYATPLFVFNVISIAIGMFDIWLLQYMSGSEQTGYYGLAYSIAAICFLFTGAMTPIITREFSKYLGESNIQKVQGLFKRYVPMLYAISAYFGIFLAFQSENLLAIFTDEKYKDAYWVLVIMSLYPLHQTYGQLSGSLFFASENTKQYRNIGLWVSLFGLILSIAFLYILQWGAVGFALKMVLIQIIGVNIQLYYNVKYLDMTLSPFIKHQVYVMLFFVLLAWLSSVSTFAILTPLWNFLCTGIIYTVLVLIGGILFPQIFSTSREELKATLSSLKRKL